MRDNISKEAAERAAVEFVKNKKNTDKIDVATIEPNGLNWVIRGTCPIDLEGHMWAEKFEVVVDSKGKIKSMDCALL